MNKEKRKGRLEKVMYAYIDSTDQVEDIIIKYIDNEATKHDISSVISKHKEKLRYLERVLKTI